MDCKLIIPSKLRIKSKKETRKIRIIDKKSQITSIKCVLLTKKDTKTQSRSSQTVEMKFNFEIYALKNQYTHRYRFELLRAMATDNIQIPSAHVFVDRHTAAFRIMTG